MSLRLTKAERELIQAAMRSDNPGGGPNEFPRDANVNWEAVARELGDMVPDDAFTQSVVANSLPQYTSSVLNRIASYRATLREISERRGPFSRDQLTFAQNVIEAMGRKAERALAAFPEDATLDEQVESEVR